MRDFEAGDAFGRYQLIRILGEGGMGIVYRATREEEPRDVAVKMLKRELAESDTYRRRFAHEARAAREAPHPSLVPILDAGEIDGHYYLAMPYVGSRTLRDEIHGEGRLSLQRTLEVASAVGSALDVLHGRGLIHRDVKPSNVLLTDADGTPILADFGLAKGIGYTVLTRTGMVGTLHYTAPELIRGEQAAPTSDIYAMACMLYECLAGTTPFGPKSYFALSFAHLHTDPDPIDDQCTDVSKELGRALLRGMEKEPSRRPQSAGAYADMLRIVARRHATA